MSFASRLKAGENVIRKGCSATGVHVDVKEQLLAGCGQEPVFCMKKLHVNANSFRIEREKLERPENRRSRRQFAQIIDMHFDREE